MSPGQNSPTRRDFLKAATALALSPLLPSFMPKATRSTSVTPNIIFILADDLGWGDAACFGHPYLQTPGIDRLAREGSRFGQFYVSSPVCSPSRVSFLTGQFPARHSIYDFLSSNPVDNERAGQPNFLDPNTTTICDLVKTVGYRTGHFGKWHLGSTSDAPAPDDYGIDFHKTFASSSNSWTFDSNFGRTSTNLITDAAIEWMKAAPVEPFFMNLWFSSVHVPVNPHPYYLDLYADLNVDIADFPAHMQEYMQTVPDVPSRMKTYCAAVSDLDNGVNTLLNYLDESGLAENTIVFFASDNGPEHFIYVTNAGMGSAGNLRGRKRELYEGGIRSHLLVRWPNHIPAGVVDDISALAAVDLLPTLCALTGVQVLPESQLDGVDVSAVLLGVPQSRTQPLFWINLTQTHASIYKENLKLILDLTRGVTELYNLSEDPEERTNVSDQYPIQTSLLVNELQAWVQSLTPMPPLYLPSIHTLSRTPPLYLPGIQN